MKLSTRCRYGTRLMLDMAQHREKGPIQLRDIAIRQDISLKYLEQIVIPLKKAGLIESLRGSKGGYFLARPPEQITIAEIVALLEGGLSIMKCVDHPEVCDRSDACPTRHLWREAEVALYEKLKSFTLWDLVQGGKACEKPETPEKNS